MKIPSVLTKFKSLSDATVSSILFVVIVFVVLYELFVFKSIFSAVSEARNTTPEIKSTKVARINFKGYDEVSRQILATSLPTSPSVVEKNPFQKVDGQNKAGQ